MMKSALKFEIDYSKMETILLYTFGFIMAMTIILALIPSPKIREIGTFFKIVLPKIPFVDMVKAYVSSKK